MSQDEKVYGKHYLVEFQGCTPSTISHTSFVEKALLKAVEISQATYISHHVHQFSPQGVSAVVVIAESHFSIHTWPEDGYAAFDIFTCGEDMKPKKAIEYLATAFNAGNYSLQEISRGLP
ncbi:MAG: adenosylmethionine decarboxylase [Bdellovibrionales bacterium]|nr:adenosylmethionine decarboxylase [Bdellovibrionales bacterium]